MPRKFLGLERAVERADSSGEPKTSVRACVCCAAIPTLQLSRGNGIHGVNPTNAERAIKRFAKHRSQADGCFTERSLQEYLVLQACSNLRVQQRQHSQIPAFEETTLEGLLIIGWRGAGEDVERSAGEP